MKRGREDNGCGGLKIKRHSTVGADGANTSVQPQPLTSEDILAYLKTVKDRFMHTEGKYDEFLLVMKDFKAQRIGANGVIERIKDLFKGHNDLILGFNAFLPKDSQIILEDRPKRQPLEFQHALNYVNKITIRFKNNESVYKRFMEILKLYREGKKAVHDVTQEVVYLFKDHPDLVEEFSSFLPDSRGLSKSIKNSTAVCDQQLHMEKDVKKEMVDSLPDDACSSGKPNECQTNLFPMKNQINNHEREQKRLYSEDHDNWGQVLPNTQKSNVRDPVEGGETCLGTSETASPEQGNKLPKLLQKRLAFFELVKGRLQNPQTYQEFLKCLNLYSEEIINREQLNNLVIEMFNKFPDLIKGFNEFLSYCESNEGYLAKFFTKSPISKVEKDRKGFKDNQLKEKEDPSEKHPLREVSNHKLSKYANKPVSELDLSNCKQCTPSYRLLPENYPMPKVGYRTHIGNDVLNDLWVSVTSGSEECPFKHMRKNQYEESLFRCEDDRFELDMLLGSAKMTTERLEELLQKIQDGSIKGEQVCIDEYLTAVQIRCIERIYGDHGLDVLELLRKNLVVSLPVVLTRLRQKQDEWLKCRAEMNKVWGEVYAKNFHKSLDHRSFHFKQQDKKSLSTKALLAEIKEINIKNRRSDEFISSVAGGNTRPIIPDLKLEYPDPGINEDLYEIIKHSADEMCTNTEQAEKIMCLWHDFLEPLFGLPSVFKSVKPKGSIPQDGEATSKGHGKITLAGPDNENAKSSSIPDELKQDNDKRLRRDSDVSDVLTGSARWERQNPCLETSEKEEGELSPSQEADEKPSVDGCTGSKKNPDTGSVNISKRCIANDGANNSKDNVNGINEQISVQRSGEHSGNGGSEGGEEVKCSQSGNGNGSHKDHEDGEQKSNEARSSNVRGIMRFLGNSEKSIVRCKPLTLHEHSFFNVCAQEKNSMLFYGNDNIYVLFRLHQALHVRIYAAKAHASEAEKKLKANKDGSSPQLYKKFLQALYGLLDGTADNATFEDVCRSIVGTQSYLLFTMDKLIFKLIKQLQTVASDEMTTKLLMLHAYEKCHTPGRLVDAVYHANASMLLHDENVYRFERGLKPSCLCIQLMEGGSERVEVFANAFESSFAKYLQKFLIKEPQHKKKRRPIFLRRTKVHYGQEDEQLGIVNALKDVYITNGLEYKISCKTYMVSYVLDTEDFFYRKKRRQGASTNSNQFLTRDVIKFRTWVDRIVNEPEPAPEPDNS